MSAPDLIALASRYWDSAALNAAVSLDLFPALSGTGADLDTLAARCGASPPHLESLLNALTGLGLLEVAEGRYRVVRSLRSLLDPVSPDSLLPALRFNADLFGLWARLGDCVRSGKPVLPGNPHLGADAERMRRFVEGMHSRAGIMARGVLPHLVLPAGARILDLGGGPGTFSVKLAERDPELQATVLDLPPVVAAAAELHAGNSVMDRVQFLGGDYHQIPLPTGQDALLYCGALHQETPAEAEPLFTRMVQALRPGGRLIVVDLMLDESRTQPVYSALFELNMLLMRPTARVHRVRDVQGLLTDAGCRDLHTLAVPGTPYHMITGTRPVPAIEIYYAEVCGLCHKAMDFFRSRNLPFTAHEVFYDQAADAFVEDATCLEMYRRAGRTDFVPQIFIGDTHIPGWRKLEPMIASGAFDRLLAETPNTPEENHP